VTRFVEPGDILIFHINARGWHTAEALPRIADDLQAQGYRFVLVSDYVGERRRPPGPLQRTAATGARMLQQVTQRAAVVSRFGAAH
jgi:hypothetical protein